MKRLIYLTTVDLYDGSAQSKQIKAMFNAFDKIYERSLLYHCSDKSEKENWIDIGSKGSKWKRSLNIFIKYIFAANRFDHIFTRDMYIALVLTALGKNIIWESHKEPNKIASFLLKILFCFPNFKVLTISKKLADIDVFSGNKVLTYHDCVDGELILRPRRLSEPLVGKKNLKAVYTGAFHKGMDVDSLIPAVESFPDIKFIFIGANEQLLSLYKEKYLHLSNLEIKPIIPHNDVIAEQRAADILLYPLTKSNELWQWTSPLKLFEYLAASKPIVASSIGPISEILNKEKAFLYNDENSLSLIKAFEGCINESVEEHYKRAKLNYEELSMRYTWESRAQFIKVFFEK